jgi:hypothetical protein
LNFPALLRRRFRRFRLRRFAVNARFLTAGRRCHIRPTVRSLGISQFRLISLLRLHPLLLIELPRAIPILPLLFRRLINRGGLILLPLAIVQLLVLLIITLVLSAGGRNRFTPGLIGRTLFLALITSLKIIPTILIAPHVFRTPRFAYDFTHWAWCEILAGSASNGIDPRTAIGEDGPLTTVKVYRLAMKIINHPGSIDNSRVVHNEIPSISEVVAEPVHITEREE